MLTCKFVITSCPLGSSIRRRPSMAATQRSSTNVSYSNRRSTVIVPALRAWRRKLCVPAVDLFKVKLVSPKGVEHEFDAPGDAYILESAESAGVELPYSCRAGDCSTCAGKIEDGIVNQSAADGYVLTGVSYCVIHTHKEEKCRSNI